MESSKSKKQYTRKSGSARLRMIKEKEELRKKLFGVEQDTNNSESAPGPSNRPHPIDVSRLQDTLDNEGEERRDESKSENACYSPKAGPSSDKETVSVPENIVQDDVRESLRIWAVHSNISQEQLRQLLRILHGPIPSLPLDPRTLLGTPTRPATLFEIEGASFNPTPTDHRSNNRPADTTGRQGELKKDL